MFEFERAVSIKSLWEAWQKIKSKGAKISCGIDQMDIGSYAHEAYNNITILNYSLLCGAYEPYKEKMFISKKERKIYISCIEDKIVQTSVAKVLSELVDFHPSVHSFIKGRSIFTAYSALKKYLSHQNKEFYKMDIRKFYESISKLRIMKKVEEFTGDEKFLNLLEKLLKNHSFGLSAGSCLSPILSNVYMTDFDFTMSEIADFYLRYVDDILIAPKNTMEHLQEYVKTSLKEKGLFINEEKSRIVSVGEGFQYLGFEVKRHKELDTLIQKGDFAGAQTMLDLDEERRKKLGLPEREMEVDEKIVSEESESFEGKNEKSCEPQGHNNAPSIDMKGQGTPEYILAIEKKCHIVGHLVNKAKTERFLSHPEKRVLLYLYKCLNDEGQRYLHDILSYCIDYDCQITQGYIDRCRIEQPMGCKKICEIFEDVCNKSLCRCNFKNEKIYPTPLIHSIREKRDCFHFSYKKESIGHFKKLPLKEDINETIFRTMSLNKQMYEIKTQQSICKNHLEMLFERNGCQEIETPQGLLIKNEEGFFIKIQ